MKKNLLAAGAAAASLILATPAAAQAAPPYDVAVGGSTAFGDHPFSATSVGGISFLTPLMAGSCYSISGTGQAHSGTAMSGLYTGDDPEDHPITIEGGTWTGCVEQFGTLLDFTHVGAWRFISEDPVVSASTTDIVAGTIDNLRLEVTDVTGLCDFSIAGDAPATFDENTQVLAFKDTNLDGSLVVEGVTGNCLGQIANGDPVDLYLTYAVNISDRPLNIS